MADNISEAASVLEEAAIQEFKAAQLGEALDLSHPDYEAARRVWNGRIDVRPALIARCTGVADVINAVNFARAQRLLVAVRGGGHHPAGYALCDGGLVIDLSSMKGMRIDPATQTAHAQAGLTWREFDREAAAFGLATPGGNISSTGVAGLTVGGGLGWLSRKYALTCDNLLSADVVTADGKVVTASPSQNKDLFWAIQGGGGNFGIVTSFEFQLHPVAYVLGGWLVYPLDQAKGLLRFLRDYMNTIPDSLAIAIYFIFAQIRPFLPSHLHGSVIAAVPVCFTGPLEEGEKVLQPLRQFGPPAVDLIQPMTYTALQTSGDPYVWPGRLGYWKSTYLKGLSDDAIEVLVEGAGKMTSPLSHIHVVQMGGAISRIGEDETAFSQRGAAFECYIMAYWTNPEEEEGHIQWTRDIWSGLQPSSTGAVYLNRHIEEQPDRLPAHFGVKHYQRLAALKTKYDPTNFFRVNHNIKPTTPKG